MTLVVVDNTLIAKMDGDMDHREAVAVRQQIDKEIKSRPIKNLVFDFSKLEFMDSSGVGMVLGRYKLITGLGGRVIIVGPNKTVEKIINVSGIHKIIPVLQDMDKAIERVCEVK